MSDNMSEVNIDSAEVESVDIVSMISKERRDVYNAMQWSRLWKRKAKKWRLMYYNMLAARIVAQRTASQRLELLRRTAVALKILQDHHCSGMEEGHMEVMDLVNAVTREVARELGDD